LPDLYILCKFGLFGTPPAVRQITSLIMKYLTYLTIAVFALFMLSFMPIGKRRKPTLPVKNAFGHIQWIQSVSYHATMDSAGNIFKGTVSSDSDTSDEMSHDAPLHRRHIAQAPIEAWMYDEYGDQLEEDKYHSDSKLFNKITHQYYPDGAIKEITDSSEAYKKTWKYAYRYDNSGNMLDSVEYYYSSDATMPLYGRKVNVYDSQGKLLEGFSFTGDTTTPTGLVLYRYNDDGKLTEIDNSRIENGNRKNLLPTEKTNYWYNKKGRLTEEATYRFHVGLVKDVKKTSDSTGYRIETYSYTGNQVPAGSQVKSFFKATYTLQEDSYDANGLLTDYTISHLDSTKHVMDKGVFHITYDNAKKNDTVMVHRLVKDDHYNVVEEDRFANDSSAISHKSHQYTYDSIGNWTMRIDFDDNKPVKIIEREIGYFKE
jgi:hypothetical protein